MCCIVGYNQFSPAFPLYLSDFLSFHTFNDNIVVKDFCGTLKSRVVQIGMQISDDALYCGKQPVFSCFFSVFVRFPFFPFLMIKFLSRISVIP